MKFKQLSLLLLIAPLPAIAAEKHVHGEAELSIATENQQILIELESPADNILGFEHAPDNKEQETLLSDSLKMLENYTNLITFDAGSCTQIDADVDSPFEKGHHDEHHDDNHKDKHDDHKDKHTDHADEDDGHSAFHLSYTLKCENPAVISKARITAFENFTGFEKIQVNWVTSDGQGSQTITAKKPIADIR